MAQNTTEGQIARNIITAESERFHEHHGLKKEGVSHEYGNTTNPTHPHLFDFSTGDNLTLEYSLVSTFVIVPIPSTENVVTNIDSAPPEPNIVISSPPILSVQPPASAIQSNHIQTVDKDGFTGFSIDSVESKGIQNHNAGTESSKFHVLDPNTKLLIHKSDAEYAKLKKRNTDLAAFYPYQSYTPTGNSDAAKKLFNSVASIVEQYIGFVQKQTSMFATTDWFKGIKRATNIKICNSFAGWVQTMTNTTLPTKNEQSTAGLSIVKNMLNAPLPNAVPFLIYTYSKKYRIHIMKADIVWMLTMFYAHDPSSGFSAAGMVQASLIRAIKDCCGHNNYHHDAIAGKPYAKLHNGIHNTITMIHINGGYYRHMNALAADYLNTELKKFASIEDPQVNAKITDKLLAGVGADKYDFTGLIKHIYWSHSSGRIYSRLAGSDLNILFGSRFQTHYELTFSNNALILRVKYKLGVSSDLKESVHDEEIPFSAGRMQADIEYNPNTVVIKNYKIDKIESKISYRYRQYVLAIKKADDLFRELFLKKLHWYTAIVKESFVVSVDYGSSTTNLGFIFSGFGASFLRNIVIGISDNKTGNLGFLNLFDIKPTIEAGAEVVSSAIALEFGRDENYGIPNNTWVRPKYKTFGGPYSMHSNKINFHVSPGSNTDKISQQSVKYNVVIFGIVETLLESAGEGILIERTYSHVYVDENTRW